MTRIGNHFRRRALYALAISVVVAVPFWLFNPSQPSKNFLNGIWVDAFNKGIHNKDQVDTLVEQVRKTGINALFVQSRRRGDVIYDTPGEPVFTSFPNDWRPLKYLREKLNNIPEKIQLHAWFVCGPVWNRKSFDSLPEGHVLKSHPDWLMVRDDGETFQDGEYYLELGLPEVHQFLVAETRRLAQSGHVDGIHLDYIRYPGRRWGYHPKVVAEFQALTSTSEIPKPDNPEWMAFRRQKISDLVAAIYAGIKNVDQEIILSAATITFAPGPENQNHWFYTSAYNHLFQDWKGWLSKGTLDWAIPMCYFTHENHFQNFKKWVDFLNDWPESNRVALGLGLYLNNEEDNLTQVRFALRQASKKFSKHLLGFVGYSYAYPAKTPDPVTLTDAYPILMTSDDKVDRDALVMHDFPIPPVAPPLTSNANSGDLAFFVDLTGTNTPPHSSITIELLKDDRLISTSVLNTAGFCLFQNLDAGDYSARLSTSTSLTNTPVSYHSIPSLTIPAANLQIIHTAW